MEKVESMQYIDISLPLDPSLVVWPQSLPVAFRAWKSIAQGDASNDTEYHANVHAGTHIDAPLHFLDHGKSIDQIDMEKCVGDAYVVEIPGIQEITAQRLSALHLPSDCRRLLIKTDNSALWENTAHSFFEDFAALTLDGAQWIVDHGLDLVGIDYLSIQRLHESTEVHKILLRADVVVVEGLNLLDAKAGQYTVVCLPIKFIGIEAAPVRAMLYPYPISFHS